MWLHDGSTDDRVRPICGMGGIGKTTIAKIIYNQNFDSFDGSSFLIDNGEVLKQPNGSRRLQRQLLSDISKCEHGKIHNDHVGLNEIRNLVFSKRVLLVLDDVEEVDPLYDVLGRPDWLFRGSKVIITTRHEGMLQPHQMFSVGKLDQDRSIKLFSFNAFREDFPPESYKEHTKRAVQICEGLPLALKVVGSSLSRKREDEWVHELTKLELIPSREILKRLKISYDSLQDVYDKSLFLDIACFFVGNIDEDYAIKILEKKDPLVKIRIKNLIDRCLLIIDHHKVLMTHRLIQDIGRELVKEESREAGERSRLWHHQDAFEVLESDTGTKVVEGLTLDMHMFKEVGNHGKKCNYEEFRDKSILSMYGSSLKQRFLNFNYGQSIKTMKTSRNDVYLRTDAFKSMGKLRLLMLNYVQLAGSFDNLPKRLVWLSWHGFSLKSIPVEFPLKKLVTLDLSHSKLEQVWMETPLLESLKILDLSYFEWLARTPNFSCLPNLDRLILKGCVRLIEVCESIGNLEMLDLLDLQDCKSLKKLPRNIDKLRSLKRLIISGCNIGELPGEIRNMNSLEVLNADGILINPLCTNSGEVKLWERIICPMAATPRKGPETILASLPRSLRKLSLSRCNLSDDSFFINFGNLPSLHYLNLSNNPFCRLSNWINNCSPKFNLIIEECPRLQLLDFNGLLGKSIYISAEGCRSLEIVMPLNGRLKFDSFSVCQLEEILDSFKKEDKTESFYVFTMCKNIQGAFEYGVSSINFWGFTIPTFTGEKCEGSSSICFTLPWLPTHRIQRLNAWCMWLNYEKLDSHNYIIHSLVKIENKTKDLTWIERSACFGYANYTGWLTLWRLGNQLEAGDEIIITFEYSSNDDVVIKECGYKIVYYDPEEEEEKGSASTSDESHHHLPRFRLRRGMFFGYESS